MRIKVPPHIEADVLIKSGRRCCICFGVKHDTSEKRGQVAHLDHNNENFSFENLAWLCFEHHDQYDSTTRQSKNFTIAEVKKYRDSLYEFIEEQRKRLGQSSGQSKAERGEASFLVGKQLKELREELGISTSEFIELVGFHSEKTYLQMESNEQECSESVIKQIAEATGILPEWIKHRSWRKHEVEPLMFRFHDREIAVESAQQVIENSSGLVYLTIAVSTWKSDLLLWQLKNLWARMRDKYLHIGLCVPIGKFKYKIYDTHICLGILDDYKIGGYAEPLYVFLKELWDYFGLDVRGIIIPNWKDEEDLYEGRVHPEQVIAKHYYTHDVDWVQAVLDFDRKRPEIYYDKYGRWIKKIQSEFKKCVM